MEIKTFKIRCSGIGQIMTNPRSKTEILSETTKTFCEDYLRIQIYGKQKQVKSKYLDKGNKNELEALDFAAKYLDLGMLPKNELFFENDFITGTPDAFTNDFIIDVKNSWDCFTFPLFDTEIDNKAYELQLQGYMHLTGKKKAKLIYCLTDTPIHLIEKECYYYCESNGIEMDEEILNSFIEKMTYQNIPDKFKIKIFDLDYDENVIKAIFDRVILCREYIEKLIFNL